MKRDTFIRNYIIQFMAIADTVFETTSVDDALYCATKAWEAIQESEAKDLFKDET